ncbi:diaminobutyrate--2-oxoglutarate transaminase [Atopomonas sediminilitoris]|uniref:diaminobutyrate--2-oxoglutarate transaminase n=1 Tax=Atopomonas sediminilitoris TaxID=2919919 RepID=UPI001F4EE6FF|nr:diaminobutyrate--2-oxoglutarate transaminase [Atopomonas sediminilitoris]MCJ8167730.1 diaminobutyrate--2-oxoglutarate transaminase [Atopomonas sediminilitoris]
MSVSSRVSDLPAPHTNAYFLARQARYESAVRSYPRKLPLAITQAQGCWLTDADGRRYLDCLAGAGTLALGHNHPLIIQAIQDTLHSGLPLHTLDLTTPLKDAFCEQVRSILPGELAEGRLQFCGPSGADAVEAAIKLAKTATGRTTVCSFSGGYHGMTQGTLALTGNLAPKQALGALQAGVQFLPYPYSYRCPFGLGGEAGTQAALHYVEHLLQDPESGVCHPAALILEAVQGEGGVIPAPPAWLKGIRAITEKLGIVLIIDEVQAGIGRTGQWFACEEAGVVPDILVMSKAIGGSLPMALLAYREALDVWQPAAHTGTFRGNQLGMATGLATLKHIASEGFLTEVQRKGHVLSTRLNEIMQSCACIGEVRGRGLMWGLEVVDKRAPANALGSYRAWGELARRIQQECFSRGLILELGGRHGAVLRLLPPLVISYAELEQLGERLHAAIRAAEAALQVAA